MPEKLEAVLLFGPPGAGKGTQGKLLGSIPGFFHHASGDVFRNLSKHTEAGRTFLEYSSRGELVPDDVTIRVWRENLDHQIADGRYDPAVDLLVLDGIPRTASQARLLDEQIRVHAVIHLHCADHAAFIERLKKRALEQGRVDDAKEEVIRRRFEVYSAETRPVLEHYDAGTVHEVEAMGTQAAVLRNVLDVLVPVQARAFAQR